MHLVWEFAFACPLQPSELRATPFRPQAALRLTADLRFPRELLLLPIPQQFAARRPLPILPELLT